MRFFFIFALLISFYIKTDEILSIDQISINEIYSNPLGNIGKNIIWTGKIEKIMSISLPLGLLLKTEGYLWYAKIYDLKKIEKDSIKDENIVIIKGTYISKEKVMFQGSMLEVPSVYGVEVMKGK